MEGTWKVWLTDLINYSHNSTENNMEPQGIHRAITSNHLVLRFMDLHVRMGHPSPKNMSKAISGNEPSWQNIGITCIEIKKAAKIYKCPDCALAKR